jgi:hypothetical protein
MHKLQIEAARKWGGEKQRWNIRGRETMAWGRPGSSQSSSTRLCRPLAAVPSPTTVPLLPGRSRVTGGSCREWLAAGVACLEEVGEGDRMEGRERRIGGRGRDGGTGAGDVSSSMGGDLDELLRASVARVARGAKRYGDRFQQIPSARPRKGSTPCGHAWGASSKFASLSKFEFLAHPNNGIWASKFQMSDSKAQFIHPNRPFM